MSSPDFCRKRNGYCPPNCRGGVRQTDLPPQDAQSARDDIAHPRRPGAQRRIKGRLIEARGAEKIARRYGIPVPPCVQPK